MISRDSYRTEPRRRGDFPRPTLRIRESRSPKQPYFVMYRDGKTILSGVVSLFALPELVGFALAERTPATKEQP